MPDFIFVRHGQSKANANKEIARDDSPLTEQGIKQARRTASEVKELGVSQVVSSPLLRAQQTAEIIAGELGIDLKHIKIIDELRERNLGILKGKPKTHESNFYYQIRDDFGRDLEVESGQETLDRMSRCIDKIKKIDKEGKILAVGHAVSGYFLIEASRGKKSIGELDSPSEISNADYVLIKS